MKEKKSLLFICLGNICRSPAAEGVMKKKAEEAGMADSLYIDSAGIGGWHIGELPDRRMRSHALHRGYILDSRARQFALPDFHNFDYIVVMDDENYRAILSLATDRMEKNKVWKMRDFFTRYKGIADVPDPYYGGDAEFNRALDLIEDGCEGLLTHLLLQ